MTDRTVQVDKPQNLQGMIFFLPKEEELPVGALERGHKTKNWKFEGRVHYHPVVIVSHPKEESNKVYVMLVRITPSTEAEPVVDIVQITSFQGATLDEIYPLDESKAEQSNPQAKQPKFKAKQSRARGKDSDSTLNPADFNEGRRSWYLPIAPSPDHPDATSKGKAKIFPTLELAHGETLRKPSYVDIRHIYKIDFSLLQPYFHPQRPNSKIFRLALRSRQQLVSRCKALVHYEAGPQFKNEGLQRSNSEPASQSKPSNQRSEEDVLQSGLLNPFTTAVMSGEPSSILDPAQGDFHIATPAADLVPGVLPKIPPR
jgi:hypothetical protein